ncbi:MAG: 50S ribosomal protein L10 [Verrucomicrobia bacterium]|nr:50S ribosomal protein L10 [Verrucomicrobiota bacterium]
MRQEKQLLLDDIKGKISQAKGFVLARYSKMDPNLASQFRTALHETGGDFEVIRKRILLKAADAAGCTIDRALLEGHIGVIFADQDLFQTTKAVFKFKAENEEVLDVIGGRFEGKLYSAQDMEAISKLPTKQEMQAQFLGLLEAVPSQLLAVIDALLTSVGHALDNKSKT